jgi:hypothetical protein
VGGWCMVGGLGRDPAVGDGSFSPVGTIQPLVDASDKNRHGEGEPPDSQDLGFGGWRDWLALLIFGPIFVVGLIAGARAGVGMRNHGSLFPVPWPLVGIVLVATVTCWLLWMQRQRERRSTRRGPS